jgi:hypothetical protein
MIEVYRIPVPKDPLRVLPKDERVRHRPRDRSGKYSLTRPAAVCSCSVHVRRGQRP